MSETSEKNGASTEPSSETLSVIATLKAKPGKHHDLGRVLLKLVEPSRQEDGCLRYELNQSHDSPELFTVVEQWRDRAALGVHAKSPHIAKARRQYPDLLADAPEIRLCRRIEP